MVEYVGSVNNSFGSVSCSDCDNDVCTHNTTDIQRSEELITYDAYLTYNGWTDVYYVKLYQNGREPKIPDGIEEARLYDAKEAAKEIAVNGARGFYIYADKAEHGTEGLIFTDEDEPEEWNHIRDTLTITSGSGTGRHRYWLNDGWNRGSSAKRDLEGIGGVRVNNTGVVVPGSIHHKSCGIYHVSIPNPIAPLATHDVPVELRPTSNTESGEHTYEPLPDYDDDLAEVAIETVADYRMWNQSTRTSIDYLVDLRGRSKGDYGGKTLREHGFIPEDKTNLKGCRYEANFALAGLLHGMLRLNGEKDESRNQQIIVEYFVFIAKRYPRTKCGQRRKLALSDSYRQETAALAIETFDMSAFRKWTRKGDGTPNFNDKYSDITENAIKDAIKYLSDDGQYPTSKEIIEDCQIMDHTRSEKTHRNALYRLVDRGIKQAHLGGNEYVYYLPNQPDPEESVASKR